MAATPVWKGDPTHKWLQHKYERRPKTEIVWENEVGMKFTIWEKREISKPGIIVKGLHAF